MNGKSFLTYTDKRISCKQASKFRPPSQVGLLPAVSLRPVITQKLCLTLCEFKTFSEPLTIMVSVFNFHS